MLKAEQALHSGKCPIIDRCNFDQQQREPWRALANNQVPIDCIILQVNSVHIMEALDQKTHVQLSTLCRHGCSCPVAMRNQTFDLVPPLQIGTPLSMPFLNFSIESKGPWSRIGYDVLLLCLLELRLVGHSKWLSDIFLTTAPSFSMICPFVGCILVSRARNKTRLEKTRHRATMMMPSA